MKPLDPIAVAVSTTPQDVQLQQPMKAIIVIPQSAVAVQISFSKGAANTPQRFVTIPAGSSYTIESHDETDRIEPTWLSLYAASAVTVHVQVWT